MNKVVRIILGILVGLIILGITKSSSESIKLGNCLSSDLLITSSFALLLIFSFINPFCFDKTLLFIHFIPYIK